MRMIAGRIHIGVRRAALTAVGITSGIALSVGAHAQLPAGSTYNAYNLSPAGNTSSQARGVVTIGATGTLTAGFANGSNGNTNALLWNRHQQHANEPQRHAGFFVGLCGFRHVGSDQCRRGGWLGKQRHTRLPLDGRNGGGRLRPQPPPDSHFPPRAAWSARRASAVSRSVTAPAPRRAATIMRCSGRVRQRPRST